MNYIKQIERPAALNRSDTLIAALEQGEFIGLKKYLENLNDLELKSWIRIDADLPYSWLG